MRQQLILNRGLAFIPFTHITRGMETHALDLCLREKCVMEILMQHMMICPKHLTLHQCGEGQCLYEKDAKRCLFSLRSTQPESVIENDALLNMPYQKDNNTFQPSAVVSFPCHSNKSKTTKTEGLWFAEEVHFRKSMVNVILKLCNAKCRYKYNSGRVDKCDLLKHVSPQNIGLRVLIERDLFRLCITMLKAAEKKRARRFLLENAHSFAFIALSKLVKGLCSNGMDVLKRPSYAKKMLPFPKRIAFEKSFGMILSKYSKCLKNIQLICEGNIFQKAIMREHYLSQPKSHSDLIQKASE